MNCWNSSLMMEGGCGDLKHGSSSSDKCVIQTHRLRGLWSTKLHPPQPLLLLFILQLLHLLPDLVFILLNAPQFMWDDHSDTSCVVVCHTKPFFPFLIMCTITGHLLNKLPQWPDFSFDNIVLSNNTYESAHFFNMVNK